MSIVTVCYILNPMIMVEEGKALLRGVNQQHLPLAEEVPSWLYVLVAFPGPALIFEFKCPPYCPWLRADGSAVLLLAQLGEESKSPIPAVMPQPTNSKSPQSFLLFPVSIVSEFRASKLLSTSIAVFPCMWFTPWFPPLVWPHPLSVFQGLPIISSLLKALLVC